MERPGDLERLQFLIGISTPKLLRLVARHGLPSGPVPLRHFGQLFLLSLCATAFNLMDARRLGSRPRGPVNPAAPVFIVGHWRTGTTWLHKLLSLDPALHAPTFFECCLPGGFVSGGGWFKARVARKLPAFRPFDQAPFGVDEPFEDEFVMAKQALVSPMLESVYPGDSRRYRGHLALETLAPAERAAWEQALVGFARRLSLLHGKRLLFKSPAHSFRIPELRRLFPGAKFVAIRRDPVDVIASTLKMETLLLRHNALQAPAAIDEEWIIRRYVMLQARLEQDWSRLPAQDRVELKYEDLCRDPAVEVNRVYSRLGLPNSATRRDALAGYLAAARPGAIPRHEVERDVRLHWLQRIDSFYQSRPDAAGALKPAA
ncbi:MAG: sulfotransferase family protein [Bacillota bacterium]